MSNREIAARRGISRDAVKYHVANALAKLGLANRQAQRLPETPIMTTLTLGPLAQISRTVRDIKESEALYGRTLGLPHLIHRHADGTEEWMAHFHDPEGRPLAIMSQVKP
jgi:hypothetical protein